MGQKIAKTPPMGKKVAKGLQMEKKTHHKVKNVTKRPSHGWELRIWDVGRKVF